MVGTLVKAYGYDYFKYGLRLDRPPIILDVVLDYYKETNRNLKDSEDDISLVEYQMSAYTKINHTTEQTKMWFDWGRFWKSLEERGIKLTYENKLFYGINRNPPNKS